MKLVTPCLLIGRCSTLLLFLLLAFTSALAQIPGQLDTSFNPGTGSDGDAIYTTTLQPDGKVIVGGSFITFNATPRNRIARLNADGSLDPTFNPGLGVEGRIFTSVLQPDGKLIIGGEFNTFDGTSRNGIARLNADGSLDTTFDPGTGIGTGIYRIHTAVLQPDGKVIIGGEFFQYNGTNCGRIARINADGSLDTTFNPGTGASSTINTVVLQPDGKVIIGGRFLYYNGTPRNSIARVNTDGSLDGTFFSGFGGFPNIQVNTAVRQPNGNVLIGGVFPTYDFTSRKNIARITTYGTLDASFNPGSGANGEVLTAALQPDGKFIIGGSFTSYNGTDRNNIARLNADGSLDATFDPGTGTNGLVNSTTLQPDGKLIFTGNFTSYNGITRNNIARVFGDQVSSAPDQFTSQFSLFPNPTAGRITIDLTAHAATEPALVEVHNLLGQTVQRSTIAAGTAKELNLQGLPEGAYLVRVNVQGRVQMQKVLLQR